MERVSAAIILAAVISGLTLSLHAGPAPAVGAGDAPVGRVAAPGAFVLDDDTLVSLAFYESNDALFPDVPALNGPGELWDRRSTDHALSLFGLCPGGVHVVQSPCGPLCIFDACADPFAKAALSRGDARLAAHSFKVSLPPLAAHDVVLWRNQAWSTVRRTELSAEPSFSPDAPSVALPKSFFLGTIGLVALLIMRLRLGSR